MMMPTHTDYQLRNPLRPVDWRCQRAQQLCAQGRRCSARRDDELTREVVQFLRHRRRCQTDRQQRRLARQYPAVCEAFRLFEQGGHERTALEARLLARRAAAGIAATCQLPVDAIATFEAVFFDVSDRLDAVDWIHVSALGSLEAPTPPVEQVNAFVRHMAYYGGETVAELVLQIMPRLLLVASEPTAEHSTICPGDRLTGQLRALFLAMTNREAAFKAAATAVFSADTTSAPSPTLDTVFGSLLAESLDSVLENLAIKTGTIPSQAQVPSRSRQSGEAA